MADPIDVATVSTPDHMHVSIAVEALKHGERVRVNPALCNPLWDARALAH